MPAIAAALVRRQKRMRIRLQARQHTLRQRANLRFLQATPSEADTCRELVVPKLQPAGWDNGRNSIAPQRWLTTPQPLTIGLDELHSFSRSVSGLISGKQMCAPPPAVILSSEQTQRRINKESKHV
jgi:hypothetical protein